ncbi:hypothetical protein EGT50_13990 [Rhodococcus xishaensis]|uniref:Uncharacterized protein n=1 Tax=Rhodococcus xishaensis TaxID=2487364 RepID=A0A438ARQ9_9NOCA|nr:hypothetical protein EGT50_13990 [Rhodococcus xishaensis]
MVVHETVHSMHEVSTAVSGGPSGFARCSDIAVTSSDLFAIWGHCGQGPIRAEFSAVQPNRSGVILGAVSEKF